MNKLPRSYRACQFSKCALTVLVLILKNIYLLTNFFMLIEHVNIVDLFKHFII